MMDQISGLRRLILALLLVRSSDYTSSAPFGATSEASCTPTCFKTNVDSSSPSNNKLNYNEGRTYTYNYESTVETRLVQTTDESSKISIKGQAVFSTLTSCDFVLTLQNVEIQSPDGQSVSGGISALEGSSIRFAYQNGKVEGICGTDTDSVWAANIKRSIVSLLQNTATESFGDLAVMEVDVSGRCPTEYTLAGEKYTKTRNLTSCSYRNGGEWVSLGVPYSHTLSGVNSDPLLKSTLKCEQSISDGIVKIADCTEQHELEPFKSNVISTVIKSSLTIDKIEDGVGSSPKILKDSLNVPVSILFDHGDPATSQASPRSGTPSTIERLVQKLCNEISSSGLLSSNVPGIYMQLGKAMRSSFLADLESVFNGIEDNQICPQDKQQKLKKLFIDSAAFVSSSDTIEFTVNRILEDKVELATQNSFAQHTSFASRPRSSTLSAMTKLLAVEQYRDRFVMASSALAYQYCSQTDPDCKYNLEYNALVSTVAELTNNYCQSSDASSIKKSITYLQALGNLNQLPEPAINALASCIESTHTSSRVKISSLSAFRRDSCNERLKEIAFGLFEDRSVSSEIRIHAYLASVRCLVQDDINRIQNILDIEESNQVGSFVSSHIRTQLSNDSPISHDLRRVYRQLSIPKTFPYDPRRFSTYFGYSKFSHVENLGIDASGNVIYSADHFIPKTAQANLTGYFFGRGYNLLELGLQFDNFENLLEKYFGPVSGKSKSKASVHNAILSTADASENDFVNLNDIDAKHEQVAPQIKAKFPKPSTGATLDLYVRELGTSVYSDTFTQSDLSRLIPTRNSVKSSLLDMYEKLLQEGAAKDFNVDFTEPTTFLNEEIVYSTIAGLPLKLQAQGTNILSLKLDGSFSIPAIRNENINDIRTAIKSRMMPSAATTIKAALSVGTSSILESGLQFEAKLHSSTGLDIDFIREEGKFELKLNLPEQKTEIIDLRSELFWTQQIENEMEVKKPVTSKWNSRSDTVWDNSCLNTLSSWVGLKLCLDAKIAGRSSSTSPTFPLAGESFFSVSVQKTEKTMEGFYFKSESTLESATDQSISLVFDTPGSQTNRKITAKGLLVQSVAATSFSIDINSPLRHVRIDYELWKEDAKRGVDLRVGIDKSVYSGTVTLKKTKDETRNIIEYEPEIRYSIPGATYTLLEGKVRGIANGLEVDLVAAGQSKLLQGKIAGIAHLDHQDYKSRKFSLSEIKLENGALGKIHLDGNVVLELTRTALNMKTLYGESLDSNFDLDFTYENIPNNELHSSYVRNLETKITSSSNPNLNFEFQLKGVLSPNYTSETNFVFHHGLAERTRTSLTQESKVFWISREHFEVKNSLEFSYPVLGLDFSINADAANLKHNQYLDFNVESGSDIKGMLKYLATSDDYNVVSSLNYPGYKLKFTEVAKRVNDIKWSFTTSLESERQGQEPFKMDADTDFTFGIDVEGVNLDTEVLSKITSTAFSDEITFHSKLKGLKGSYLAGLRLAKPDHEILEFETDYKEALGNSPTSFSSKAFVVEYVDASLSESHDTSSSVFNLQFNWLPSGRKVIASTNLKRASPELYNFDGQLQWDAEKDPSKSASVQSSTLFQSRTSSGLVFESKNTIIIQSQPQELVLKGKVASEDFFNGETSGEIQFKNVAGQNYGIQLKTINEARNNNKYSNIQIKIYSPNQKGPIELEWNNKASNVDINNYLGEYVGQLKIAYDETQNIHLLTELHSLNTNKWTISGLVEASGSLLADKMRLDFNSVSQTGHALYGISSNYRGQSNEFLIDVDYDVWSVKKTLEYTYKVRSPFYRTLKSMDGYGKFGYLFTSWTNFEIFESGNVVINNNKPSTWEYGGSFLQNDFKAKYNLNSDGNSIVNFMLNGKATSKRITGVLKNKAANFGTDTELIFEVDRFNKQVPNPSVNLKLNFIPQNKSIGTGTLSYRFNLKSLNNGEVYETSFRGRSLSNSRLAGATKIEFSKLRKSFEVMLSTEKTSTRKLYFLLSGPNENKYNVESVIRWGDEGKTVTASGTLSRSGSSIDGTLMVDSPHFNADKWKVHVLKDLSVTGRHSLSLIAHSADTEIGTVLIDYSQKRVERDQTTHYNGSLAVKVSSLDFIGAFNTIDKIYQVEKDAGEEGRQIKTILELNNHQFPVNFEVLFKRTNLQDQALWSFCNMNRTNCQVAQVLNEKFQSKAKSGQIFTMISETFTTGSDGQKRSTSQESFIVKALREGQSFEHSTSLRSTWPRIQELGYRLFSLRNGMKQGVEIALPQRIIAAEVNKEYGSDQTGITVEAWLNKLRKPDRKLTVTFNSVVLGPTFREFSDTDGTKNKMDIRNGREISLSVQHPALTKDLMVKAKSVLKSENENSTSSITELTLDVFKLPSQALAVTFQSSRDFSDESVGQYALDFGLKSQSGIVRLELHSDIRTSGQEISTKSNLVYLNRDRQERNYNMVFDYGHNKRGLQITGPTGRIMSYLSSYNFQEIPGTSTFDSYEVRREIFLPGMADTRIFQNKVSFDETPNVDIKMFTVSNPPGQYQELSIGFKNDREFALNFAEHDSKIGQRNLVDFNVALNNSRLLFVKTEWDKDNIKDFVMRGQRRLEDTSSRFKSMIMDSSNYLASEAKHLASKIRNALPEVQPLVQSMKEEILNIKTEVESLDHLENFGHYFEFILNIFGTDSKSVRQASSSFFAFTSKVLSNLMDYITIKLPQKISVQFETLPPAIIKSVQNGLHTMLDAVVEAYNSISRKIVEGIEKLSNLSHSPDLSSTLADATNGIGKLWSDTLFQSLDSLSKLWNSLRSSSMFEHPYFREFFARYERVVSNVIEDYKTQVDGFRQSVLETLSSATTTQGETQKEVQEFLAKVMEYVEMRSKGRKDNFDNGKITETQLRNEVYDKFIIALNKVTGRIFSVDMKNGLIIAQIPLPTPVRSLTDMDRLFDSLPSYPFANKIKVPTMPAAAQEYFTYNNFNLHKLIGSKFNDLKNLNLKQSLEELLPPFDAYGLIIGSQFYRTFDGRFYRFVGKCQYLLASDFVDKNFTVVVNYKNDPVSLLPQKSIVVTDHKNTVSIEPSLQVLVDGVQAKIPSNVGGFKISRNQNWIHVENSDGVEVGCSTVKDVCIVQLNGFYQGKTSGLLGTLNNEYFDDLRSANGQISDSSQETVVSWKLNDNCEEDKQTKVVATVRSSDLIQKCYAAFQLRSSPLSPCFNSVTASNYEHICTSIIPEESWQDARHSVCTASIGYKAACKNANINIDTGSLC